MEEEIWYVIYLFLRSLPSVTDLSTEHEGKDLPTAKALSEHISKLKRKAGGKAGAATSNGSIPKKAPMTPKKPAAPKTPTSSAKRTRDAMSEEDDSEPEMTRARLSGDVARRSSIPRSSKSTKKTYDENSDDDGDEDDTEDLKPAVSHEEDDVFDSLINFDGAAEPKPTNSIHAVNGFSAPKRATVLGSRGAPRKDSSRNVERSKLVMSDDESDVSDFEATFN